MTQYHTERTNSPALGFKCTSCGYSWTSRDVNQGICPVCGYHCNSYVCQILPVREPAENHIPESGENFKCTSCGYIWKKEELRSEKCPSCGYACNAYSCQVLAEPQNEDKK